MTGAKEAKWRDQAEYRHLLAAFVRGHEREVVARWIDAVRQRPSEKDVPDSVLVARVSPFLRWLADERSPALDEGALSGIVNELVDPKLTEEVAESEIVAGWSLLRECLIRQWGATLEPEDWIPATAYMNRILDNVVVETIESVVRSRERILSLVENVSRDTLESASLGELLRRLLHGFVRATAEIDVAAIALCEREDLRVHAVVGMELTECTTAIGEGFIGRVAVEKSPMTALHSMNEPLHLIDGIKASAVRTAYGVPLTEGGNLVGIAAVGSRTAWEFPRVDLVVFDAVSRRAAGAISYWKLRERLDREKAQLDFLLAQMPAGVIVAEAPSGKLTLHNAQVELIWRRPFIASESAEDYGAWPGYRADGQRLSPADWPLSRAVRRGETTRNEEIEILRGDGSRGTILESAAPIRGPGGKIVGGVSTLTDITEKRLAEQQLKVAVQEAHRAAMFQKIVGEASQQLAQAFEIEATVISIARLGLPQVADWCHVYELCDDDNLRLVGATHVDPQKTASLRERLSRNPVVKPGRYFRGVLEQGVPLIVPKVSVQLLRDAAVDPLVIDVIHEAGIEAVLLLPLVARGRTLGVLTYSCAESKRRFAPEDVELAHELARRAALALDNAHLYDAARRAATELSGLISMAADAIITVDDKHRIIIYNEGAERIFRWKNGEVLGKPLDILIPERILRECAAGAAFARTLDEPLRVLGIRKGGIEFPAEAAISQFEVGEKRFLSVVLRDISARLRLEREREVAIAARDEVMGIVAHDLRNPLATILMLASVLEERAGDEPARKSAKALERAANRMDRLIQDLLDVTRIESGHLSVAPVRVSACDIICDCIESLKAHVASASLEIECESAPGLADVRADPDRLTQVLENLISNAVKFSRAGGRIKVGARTADGEVLFWVKDEGVGISTEHLPHVFDRYWQAQNAQRRGVGLGLCIVKGIVDAHGGRVWAESVLGGGTTFFFTIPVDSSSAQPSTEITQNAP